MLYKNECAKAVLTEYSTVNTERMYAQDCEACQGDRDELSTAASSIDCAAIAFVPMPDQSTRQSLDRTSLKVAPECVPTVSDKSTVSTYWKASKPRTAVLRVHYAGIEPHRTR